MTDPRRIARLTQQMPILVMQDTADISPEVWYVERFGRYRERVHYKRRNPLAMYAYIMLPAAIWAYVIDTWLVGYMPTWAYAIPVVFVLAAALWALASRMRSTSEERFREDSMYPPKEYWNDE